MKKILVIEDEQSVRDIILDILDAENFFAIGAENGLIGVELAQESSPDLIICDVMMPGLGGHDVLAKLRQEPTTATIPFVFLTAKAEQDDFREGMALGADDYLAKPFSRTELLRTISTRLEKQATVNQQVQQKLSDLRNSITLSLPHELNNPLTIIAKASSLLIEECHVMESEEIQEVAEGIYRSSQRLCRLTQNFLLYAQLELAAIEPERLKVLRNGYTRSAQAAITEFAVQKAQQMNREADLQLELADSALQISTIKLKKIIEELLDNAFKFSQPGTPVRIASLVREQVFTLHVIDYGRGMSTEQVTQIGAYMQFERRLYEQQGSGLGLAIVKRLSQLHGGEFGVESILEKQTIVRLVLPIAGSEVDSEYAA